MKKTNTENTIEILFNENFHSLVFSSFHIVKDYEQAEDIVQNVFVKIWQNYDKLKHFGNIKSYIYRAVKNSSLNYLRNQKLVNTEQKDIDTLNIENDTGSDKEKDEADLLNKVHHAVDKLPEKWREAFILSKYEKLKYSEIAVKMNISIKTVEKYISKALAFIRSELKFVIILILYLLFFKKL